MWFMFGPKSGIYVSLCICYKFLSHINETKTHVNREVEVQTPIITFDLIILTFLHVELRFVNHKFKTLLETN